MIQFSRFLCIAFVFLSLAACESDTDKEKAEQIKTDRAEETAAARAKAEKEKEVPICPQVAIVRDLESLTDFGGEKPSADQLIAAAKMKNVNGTCQYRDDGIDITFELSLVGARGPRLEGLRVSFPYFIAVVDPDGDILNKIPMDAAFKFPSDSKTAPIAEELHVFIPLAKAKRKTGPDYQVLMGFQLTQAQMDQRPKQP